MRERRRRSSPFSLSTLGNSSYFFCLESIRHLLSRVSQIGVGHSFILHLIASSRVTRARNFRLSPSILPSFGSSSWFFFLEDIRHPLSRVYHSFTMRRSCVHTPPLCFFLCYRGRGDVILHLPFFLLSVILLLQSHSTPPIARFS